MALKRYVATADTTITNAYFGAGQLANDQIRATDANLGGADTLEVYSINSRVFENSDELSRVLVTFDYDSIQTDRTNYLLPQSGSVKFFLKMYNVEHTDSVPKDFYMSILPISRSWEEGIGMDLENYTDLGSSDYFGEHLGKGATWLSSSNTVRWTNEGGDYVSGYEKKQYFETGVEDLEVDVTDIIEKKLLSSSFMYGFGVRLTGSIESDGDNLFETYYTKKFSARSSEYFYKRPILEARWEPQITDDYPTYKISNSLTAITDESNYVNVYFYNQYSGKKVPITSSITTSSIEVAFYTGSQLTGGDINAVRSPETYSKKKIDNSTFKFSFVINRSDTDLTPLTNGSTSILTASYKIYNSPSTTLYSETGSINLVDPAPEQSAYNKTDYTFKLMNVKPTYKSDEKAIFQVFSRELNWNPNIYTKAVQTIESTRHKNLYYKIVRVKDEQTIVDYGTGSFKYTQVGYDRDYNFFEVDMSMLEPDYSYEIRLGLDYTYTFKEAKEKFKFRVVE